MAPGMGRRAVVAVALAAFLSGCAGPSGDDGGVGADGDGSSRSCPRDSVVVVQAFAVDNLVALPVGPEARQEFPLGLASHWPAGAPWSCVRSVVATIAWTNGITQSADLYVGLDVPAAGLSVRGADRQQVFVPGDHTESVSLAPPGDPATLASTVLVVYSDWPGLGAGGIPVQATVTLEV